MTASWLAAGSGHIGARTQSAPRRPPASAAAAT